MSPRLSSILIELSFPSGPTFGQRLDGTDVHTGVAGSGADQAVVLLLFQNVGTPAGHAGHDEDRRVELNVKSHRMIEPPRGPVEVGVEVLFPGQNVLNNRGRLFPFHLSRGLRGPVSILPQDAGPDISG